MHHLPGKRSEAFQNHWKVRGRTQGKYSADFYHLSIAMISSEKNGSAKENGGALQVA
jgi:hypothetical protein